MSLSKRKICLVILDGWGIGKPNFSNPIYQADTPFLDNIKQHFPFLALQASGASVGLPYNTPGNSQIGHLTIGTGQILDQDYVRISKSIDDKSFFQNNILLQACQQAKKNQSTIHLIGLLSDSIANSSFDHLLALLDLASQQSIKKLNLHLFLDGEDSSPFSGKKLLKRLKEELQKKKVGKIASIAGRFYAMDHNGHWDRIARYYQAITQGKGRITPTLLSYVQHSYEQDITDEIIPPTLIGNPQHPESLGIIKDNDIVIMFNFRGDNMQQLGKAFLNYPDFQEFSLVHFPNLKIITFTRYDQSFPFPVIFPPQKITTSLSQILSQAGKRQLHLAEEEKANQVTYFFDGLKRKPSPGEYWVIVPALSTLHPEEYPQLNAPAITTRLTQAFEENIYDFILVNYANPDIIGHIGNMAAGIQCAKFLDNEMKKVATLAQKYGYSLIITSSHGNMERLMNPLTGEIETNNNTSLVPFHFLDTTTYNQRARTPTEVRNLERQAQGIIADITPTILDYFNIPIPPSIIGQSLRPLL